MTAFVMFSKVELFANFKPEWLVVAPFLTGEIKRMSRIGGSAGEWGWGGEGRRGEKGRHVLSREINGLPPGVSQTRAMKQTAKVRPRIYT